MGKSRKDSVQDPAESNEMAPDKPQPDLSEQREGSFRDVEHESEHVNPATSLLDGDKTDHQEHSDDED